MRAAALLMSGQEGGDLEVVARGFAGPGVIRPSEDRPSDDERSGDRRTVLAVVEADGVGILEAARVAQAAGQAPTVEFFVYAVGSSLDVLDAVALRFARPAEHEAQLLGAGARVLAPLRIRPPRPGEAIPEIRVLVRVGESFGLRKVALPQPFLDPSTQDPSEAPTGLGDLDDSGRWLVAWSAERPVHARADALDADGTALAFDPAMAQPSAFRIPPELAEADIDLPADFGTEPWPSLLRRHGTDVLTGVLPARSEMSLQLPEELGRKLEGVFEGYLEALAMRAEGDAHGATFYLAELEAKSMDELGDEALQMLLTQEVRAYQRVRDRLGDDIRPTLALIRLHLDVADEHRRQKRYLLSSFAMGSAVRLTDWYVEEAGRGRKADELRGEAAAILSSLAAAIKLRGGMAEAIDVYRRALSYRSDDLETLFGLATSLSKFGEAKEAADLYERVLEARPEHHEARLRRGVMLQREGGGRDLRKARENFTQLADDETVPEWIASLAAQQLVRMALDSGRLDAAARRLDTALTRFPEHAPFRFAAIRLAELRGDRAAVAERLEIFDPATAQPSSFVPGGRIRFHQAPDDGLRILRERLAELEESRHGDLATAVARIQKRRGKRR